MAKTCFNRADSVAPDWSSPSNSGYGNNSGANGGTMGYGNNSGANGGMSSYGNNSGANGGTMGYGTDNNYAPPSAGGCSRDPSQDRGNSPSVFDMPSEARLSGGSKKVLWTGKNIQIAVERVGDSAPMEPLFNDGSDIALYVMTGEGEVRLGRQKNNMSVRQRVGSGSEILIPEGAYWYLVSDVDRPLNIIAHYAPRKYPFGYNEK